MSIAQIAAYVSALGVTCFWLAAKSHCPPPHYMLLERGIIRIDEAE